jgi:SAM-dependent methyltransferase
MSAQIRPDFERLRRTRSETRSLDRLIAHFELESSLSQQLMSSQRTERTALYGKLYDRLFASLPDHPQRTGRKAVRTELIDAQLALLQPFLSPNSTYVEIGCGDALLTKAVATHVEAAFGVDVTERLVETDRPNSFQFALSDGINIPLSDNTADLVYSNQLMEHLHPEDAAAQLMEIFRILKPGGRYICVTPNRLTGPHDISVYFGYEPKGFHLREYDHRSLARLFRAAGFKRVSALVQAKGLRVHLPAGLAGFAETLIEMLPAPTRRHIVLNRTVMNLAGLTLVGRK